VLINAGAGARVVIRNLALYGMGTGNAGVSITGSGQETHIENCIIDGFVNYGVISFLNFTAADTTIRHCGDGIRVDNAGGVVKGNLERVLIQDCTGIGLYVVRNATVTVRNSSATGNSSGSIAGFEADDGGQLFIENCLAARNTAGIRTWTNFSANTGGIVRMSNCVITDNTTGVQRLTGTIETFTNNKISGNGTQVFGSLTAVAQQ
jgi:hypothetical protein